MTKEVNSHSQAILIGTSSYQDPGFTALPAVRNSLREMQRVLADPHLCGWPTAQISVLEDPTDTRKVVQKLRQLSRDTRDVLLIYYVGHGILLPRSHLCLILSDTTAQDPDITGLEYNRIREAILDSPARTKVVILDCCYSGRIIQSLSATGIADCTDTNGTYTLTASDLAAHVVEYSQQQARPTSFTGELLDLIRTGIPGGPPFLTFGLLYPHLRNRLLARNLPAPNQRGTDNASYFAFSRNPGSKDFSLRSTGPRQPHPVSALVGPPASRPDQEATGSQETHGLRVTRPRQVRTEPSGPTNQAEPELLAQPAARKLRARSAAPQRQRKLATGRLSAVQQLSRTARLSAIAAVGSLALVAGGLTLNHLSGRSRVPSLMTYTFARHRYPDGLVTSRHWTLGGVHGSQLTETVTASSADGRALRVTFEEPVLAAIAPRLSSVQFRPRPVRVAQPARLVRWTLTVPAHGFLQVGYSIAVRPTEAARQQLQTWADSFNSLPVPSSSRVTVPHLASLAMRPLSIRLTAGKTVRVKLTGLMSDGTAAPQSILTQATWRVADPALAKADSSGLITARKAGRTELFVSAGKIRAKASITIADRLTPSGSQQSSPPSPGSGSSTAPPLSPKPTGIPTLTPTPLS
jgi:Caspase domain